MGRVWGYKPEARKPWGMLSRQSIGKGAKNQEIVMKLPKVYDMQRMIFAKYLARLNQFPIYCAKMDDPNFEDKVDEFRKHRLDIKAPSYKCKSMKKVPEFKTEMSKMPASEFRELRPLKIPSKEKKCKETKQGKKFDFDKMNYTSFTLNQSVRQFYKKREEDEIDWKQINWRKRFIKDQGSGLMNEVVTMNRMVSQNYKSFLLYQQPIVISMDASRYCLKSHDWSKVALSLCSTLQCIGRVRVFSDVVKYPGNFTVTWLHGFFSLVNSYKDDIEVIKQYAFILIHLFDICKVYLGIQVASWFIQKGYFIEAHRLLQDHFHLRDTPGKELRKLNPKERISVYISDFIKAVKLYAEWKKDFSIHCATDYNADPGLFEVVENGVRRKGEAALTAYEVLYHRQKQLKTDIMSIVVPLMELLDEYRSPYRAFEVLQEIVNLNSGNLVVEEYYVKFLEMYASKYETVLQQISIFELRRKLDLKLDVKKPPMLERHKAKRKIKALREAKIKAGIDFSFKKINPPGFSW